MPLNKCVKAATLIATLASVAPCIWAQGTPPATRYAEGIYEAYQEATDGGITFSVAVTGTGPMTELAGKTFSSLIPVPDYRIESVQHGTKLRDVSFSVPEDPMYGLFDMNYSAERFEEFGYALASGTYRRLLVTATISGDTRSHQALEFCWAASNYCTVLDPTVVFLQSKVANRSDLMAAGWGSQMKLLGPVSGAAPTANAVEPDSKGRCGLASHPSWTGEQITWPAYTQKFKDVFGITLVSERLGEQVDGINCDRSCHPEPFSRSDASSGSGTLGWTVACANTGDAKGKNSHTGRSIAETDCTHRWSEHATASVTIKGSGANISADWKLGGGVTSNGGVLTDSCAVF